MTHLASLLINKSKVCHLPVRLIKIRLSHPNLYSTLRNSTIGISDPGCLMLLDKAVTALAHHLTQSGLAIVLQAPSWKRFLDVRHVRPERACGNTGPFSLQLYEQFWALANEPHQNMYHSFDQEGPLIICALEQYALALSRTAICCSLFFLCRQSLGLLCPNPT